MQVKGYSWAKHGDTVSVEIHRADTVSAAIEFDGPRRAGVIRVTCLQDARNAYQVMAALNQELDSHNSGEGVYESDQYNYHALRLVFQQLGIGPGYFDYSTSRRGVWVDVDNPLPANPWSE